MLEDGGFLADMFQILLQILLQSRYLDVGQTSLLVHYHHLQDSSVDQQIYSQSLH